MAGTMTGSKRGKGTSGRRMATVRVLGGSCLLVRARLCQCAASARIRVAACELVPVPASRCLLLSMPGSSFQHADLEITVDLEDGVLKKDLQISFGQDKVSVKVWS